MTIYLKQSTASQEVCLGYFVDSTNGNDEETGLTIANTDIKIHKAGATTLANKNSGGATHISNGIYYAVLDATDTDTLGSMAIYCHPAGALATKVECVVLAANIYDALIGGTDLLQVDLTQVVGATTNVAALATNADAIKTKTDFLPSFTAGNAGGLFIAGTNAPVTITGSGNALTLTSTGANGVGLAATGNGTGHGVLATSGSGATGDGLRAVSAATTGTGATFIGSANSYSMSIRGGNGGLQIDSDGSFAALQLEAGTGSALDILGDGTNPAVHIDGDGGDAMRIDYDVKILSNLSITGGVTITQFTGNAPGLSITGNGSGSGVLSTGGATGYGIHAEGGATSGSGILASGPTSGYGIHSQGATAGAYVVGTGANSKGMRVQGTGTEEGLYVQGGSSGHGAVVWAGSGGGNGMLIEADGAYAGIKISGGLTSGSGIDIVTTDGHGINITAAGTLKHGILSTGSASGAGIVAQGNGSGRSGIEVYATDGAAIYAEGGSGADGHGIWVTGGTNGDGIKAEGQGTGVDVRGDITGNLTGNLSGSVGSVAAGGIDAASIAAGAIDAATFAADVDAEIAAMVWNAATASYGSAGSYGEALEAVGSSADPWLTNLPGAYSAGSAGYIIGTNINATISSMASQTSVDTIDGIVDDILVDTAEIGVAGAGLTNINLPNQTMDIVGNITGNLSGSVGSVGAGGIAASSFAAGAVDAAALATDAVDEIADGLLGRNVSGGSSTGRTVKQALHFIRNKWVVATGTLTVYDTDDSTPSWTAAVTGTAGADPVTAVDP